MLHLRTRVRVRSLWCLGLRTIAFNATRDRARVAANNADRVCSTQPGGLKHTHVHGDITAYLSARQHK